MEIEVTVSGSPDVTALPVSLTFTASDWDEPQTVTVSAAHDSDAVDDDGHGLAHGRAAVATAA